jgi:hypothetical protein
MVEQRLFQAALETSKEEAFVSLLARQKRAKRVKP